MNKFEISLMVLLILCLLSANCNGHKKNQTEQVQQKNNPVEVSNEGDTLCYPSEFIPVDRNEVQVYVSEDEKMRIYCWDTYQGGTCPDYAAKCQYRTNDGKVRLVDMGGYGEENNPSVNDVHSVRKNDGTTIYLIERYFRISSNSGESWIDAYVIDKDTLKAVKVCGNDHMSSSYSIADWYDRTIEGWDWLYEYDAETKNMYVPETDGESYPFYLTDRYTVYHFDGEKFVPKRNQPHRGLHPSLHDYQCLELFFHTKNHIVRIDRLNNGVLRYASWKSPSTISDKPDLVILGGRYGNQYDADSEEYTFEKGSYTYLCGVDEYTPTEKEGVVDHHKYLIVEKGDEVILKEERLLSH